jgi:hypothetical protein
MMWSRGNRRDQRLFQKSELPIPEQTDAREDRREQHRHADHAGRHKLEVAPPPGLLIDGTQPKAEHQQVQQGLAERRDDLRARPRVPFDLTQPQNEDGGHVSASRLS